MSRCCRSVWITSLRKTTSLSWTSSSMSWTWWDWVSMAQRPAATGRSSYHPSMLLRLYLYGYLKRIQSQTESVRTDRQSCEMRVTCAGSPRVITQPPANADLRPDAYQRLKAGAQRSFVVADASFSAGRLVTAAHHQVEPSDSSG
jgi:hypothetical protein